MIFLRMSHCIAIYLLATGNVKVTTINYTLSALIATFCNIRLRCSYHSFELLVQAAIVWSSVRKTAEQFWSFDESIHISCYSAYTSGFQFRSVFSFKVLSKEYIRFFFFNFILQWKRNATWVIYNYLVIIILDLAYPKKKCGTNVIFSVKF